MGGLSAEQKLALQERIRNWRERAEMAGSMHPLWDFIFDAESLLTGGQTLLRGSPTEVYSQLMAIR